MRITTNQFPTTLSAQLQGLLQKEIDYEAQSSTGLRITQPSDDPSGYHNAQIIQTELATNQSYINTNNNVSDLASYNHQAMSDLQTALTSAGEIATKANSTYSDSDLKAMATQLDGIISEVASVANRQKDGNYLFGGTSNQAPITVTGSPPVYSYNTSTNGSTTTAQLTAGASPVSTGILAGRSTGTPTTDGFLYDSTTTPPTDTLTALIKLRDDLNLGQAGVSAIQNTDLAAINQASDLASKYVGSTAAQMTSINLNLTTLQNQVQTNKTSLSNVTGADLANAITQLQQTTTNYQAALQSGAKILNLSIMDYLS